MLGFERLFGVLLTCLGASFAWDRGPGYAPHVIGGLPRGQHQEFRTNSTDHLRLLSSTENFVVLGGRNALYNVTVGLDGHLDLTGKLIWGSTDAHRELCTLKGKQEGDCQNYIRIFAEVNPGRALICGTNSYKPMCSAVCVFRMKDILEAFEGPFKAQKDTRSNWLPVSTSLGPTEPRPGSCVEDSRTLPSQTVNFVKNHPLMEKAVPALYGEPLLVTTGAQLRLTSVAVVPTTGPDGRAYSVLFAGTADGRLVKFYAVSGSTLQKVVVSEMQVLPPGAGGEPTDNGWKANLSHHIPQSDCSNYTNCASCVGTRDPFCGWHEESHSCREVGTVPLGHLLDTAALYDVCPENNWVEERVVTHGTISSVGRDPQSGFLVHESHNHTCPEIAVAGAYSAQTMAIALVVVAAVALAVGGLVGIVVGHKCRLECPMMGVPPMEHRNQLTWSKSRHMAHHSKDINLLMNTNQFYSPPASPHPVIFSNAQEPTPQARRKMDNLGLVDFDVDGKDRRHESKNSTESLEKDPQHFKTDTLQKGSAVCVFRMKDILEAFEGPFKAQKDTRSNWLPVSTSLGPTEPRPGSCVEDSRTLPSQTVNFVKNHPLMEKAVPALYGEPLLVTTGAQLRLTSVAVVPTTGPDGRAYSVLFAGTADGRLVKFYAVAGNTLQKVVVSEMQVLPPGQAVKQLTTVGKQILAISENSVVSIPQSDCSNYTNCASCVGTRDPFCGWHEESHSCREVGTVPLGHLLDTAALYDVCPENNWVEERVVTHGTISSVGRDPHLGPTEPRPGSCVEDSRTLPSQTVNFVKNHPLMEKAVPALYGEPLLVTTGAQLRLTSVAVVPTTGPDGRAYSVLFAGTADGRLVKFYAVSGSTLQKVVVSEMQVLPPGQAVKQLTTVGKQILAISENSVVRKLYDYLFSVSIPQSDCSNYTNCASCVGTRDPFCGWHEESHSCREVGTVPLGHLLDTAALYDGSTVGFPCARSHNHTCPEIAVAGAYSAQTMAIALVVVAAVALAVGGLVGIVVGHKCRLECPMMGVPPMEHRNQLTWSKSRHMAHHSKDINLLMNTNQFYSPPASPHPVIFSNAQEPTPQARRKMDNLGLVDFDVDGKDRRHESKNSTESLEKDPQHFKTDTLQKVKKTYI
uniref:Putative semaphorin n=1 Tax=Lutzomyia longipalpis TaxID=7200 RepID=A0A1B0CDL0_LUTLO